MKKLFLILLFAWICIENSNIYAFPVSAPNSENPASPIEKAESPIAKASPSGSNTNSQNTRFGSKPFANRSLSF